MAQIQHTPHDIIRAIELLERNGYSVRESKMPAANWFVGALLMGGAAAICIALIAAIAFG